MVINETWNRSWHRSARSRSLSNRSNRFGSLIVSHTLSIYFPVHGGRGWIYWLWDKLTLTNTLHWCTLIHKSNTIYTLTIWRTPKGWCIPRSRRTPQNPKRLSCSSPPFFGGDEWRRWINDRRNVPKSSPTRAYRSIFSSSHLMDA
jgi:hypothetical protein